MFNISQFLEKFKRFETSEIGTRETIAQALKEIVGINVPLESITYKNAVITLSVEGMVRSELYIKKQKILEMLQKSMVHLKDIRFS